MKCFASEIWYRLHVKIMDVKFSLLFFFWLKHFGQRAGVRSTQISPSPLSPGPPAVEGEGLEMVAGKEEQTISFTAQLQAWLTILAKF